MPEPSPTPACQLNACRPSPEDRQAATRFKNLYLTDCVATSLNYESTILPSSCQKIANGLMTSREHAPSHEGLEALHIAHAPTIAVFELALCNFMDYMNNNMN